jgi:hypothetical protein
MGSGRVVHIRWAYATPAPGCQDGFASGLKSPVAVWHLLQDQSTRSETRASVSGLTAEHLKDGVDIGRWVRHLVSDVQIAGLSAVSCFVMILAVARQGKEPFKGRGIAK